MRRDLPAGTVTFLFTDVERSTKLLHDLGPEAYAAKLAEHRRIVREACTARGGVEVDTQGDAFFVAFPTAPEALDAAQAITEELASGPITLRMGLHTGTPLLTEEGYVGEDVHFAARVAASSHGGQVVLSRATRALLDERYGLIDLGEHRLKDIPDPVPIYQLGDGQFPPLKTISNTNLPRPASSFVGRERELTELLARIGSGARLLTLTGPGGSGKTRLALEAAASLVPEYKAGVLWVGLASLRDPALVTETIAQALGAKDGLVEHIGEREMLLLLDNLEQVIEAAPALSTLLQACPNLTLLGTSRELLRVQGEVEYEVPPLASPEAVALFSERAQLEPSDEITELCARLDNLPLAVELAAARTKGLTPTQIRERLSQRLDLLKGGRDADPRQQTLRATIEWSYDLLSEAERRLFRALSIFPGGCTLDAAEAVADADVDTLQSLVEKSLLRFTISEAGSRYWMLETIRGYAGERLEEAGEAEATGRRHAERVLVELQPLHAFEPQHAPDPDAVLPELVDVRAAVSWVRDSKDVSFEFTVVVAAAPYWQLRGGYREALLALEKTLARAGDQRPELLAAGLRWAADFAFRLNDERAVPFAEESVRLYEQAGDPVGLGSALVKLSHAVFDDTDRAIELLHRAIAVLTPQGPSIWLAAAVDTLGYIELERGNYELAAEYMTQALEIGEAYGAHNWPFAAGLQNLAIARLCLGQLDEAEALFERSVSLALELQADATVANHLECLAALKTAQGEPQTAAVLLGAAEVAREELETPLEPVEHRLHANTMQQLSEELGEQRLFDLMNRGAAITFDTAVALTRLGCEGARGR